MARRSRFIGAGAVALAMSVLGAGCAADKAPGPPSAASGHPPSVSAPAVTGSAAGCSRGSWQAAPIAVTHSVAVPPVPVIATVRAAQHPECGYDRLVLDITGAMPSYSIRYAPQVTSDPSGRPITLPGQHFLLITLRSAQAHSPAGAPTITRQVQVPGYPALRSWVLAGDFEGAVTIAVGLPKQSDVRAGELAGHLYIDVRE